jgi:hypothetical protein
MGWGTFIAGRLLRTPKKQMGIIEMLDDAVKQNIRRKTAIETEVLKELIFVSDEGKTQADPSDFLSKLGPDTLSSPKGFTVVPKVAISAPTNKYFLVPILPEMSPATVSFVPPLGLIKFEYLNPILPLMSAFILRRKLVSSAITA